MDVKKDHAIMLAMGVLLLWFLLRKHNSISTQNSLTMQAPVMGNPQSQTNDFAAPYFQTTPGIADSPSILFGGPNAFQGTINANVNVNPLNSLYQKYIPLYGFVGMAYH